MSLCATYAPHPDEGGQWRVHRVERPLPQQGWKLHLSATLLSAVDLFERCAQTLVRSECEFKVAGSLDMVRKLNDGLAGRSQTGKIITVYCPEPGKARAVAEELHVLTRGLPGPAVPSDRRFRPESNVFYRYGAYEACEIEIDGRKVPAYRDPSGNPVPDKRTQATAVPSWLDDPFADDSSTQAAPQRGRKQMPYVAFKPLAWRGRGGVYLARRNGNGTLPQYVANEESLHGLSLVSGIKAVADMQQYVMKEGLRHGGVGLDGRCGIHYVRKEFRNLKSLAGIVPVPAPVDFFYRDGNAYLVTEFIDGKNVEELLRDGRLPLEKSIAIARQMVEIVASLHAAGWCWRDCKTRNFLYSGGKVWAIDFEFAVRMQGRPSTFISTPGYFLDYQEVTSGRSRELQDLYALGTTLHRLFAGVSDEKATSMDALPPLAEDVPSAIRDLIAGLRNEIPRRRPSAASAKRVFERF